MENNEIFRENLFAEMKKQQISAAALSKKAGLNERAVKDIEERRSKSPRLTTAIALARALDVSVYDLLGVPARKDIIPELAKYLSDLSPDEQKKILDAILALTGAPASSE